MFGKFPADSGNQPQGNGTQVLNIQTLNQLVINPAPESPRPPPSSALSCDALNTGRSTVRIGDAPPSTSSSNALDTGHSTMGKGEAPHSTSSSNTLDTGHMDNGEHSPSASSSHTLDTGRSAMRKGDAPHSTSSSNTPATRYRPSEGGDTQRRPAPSYAQDSRELTAEPSARETTGSDVNDNVTTSTSLQPSSRDGGAALGSDPRLTTSSGGTGRDESRRGGSRRDEELRCPREAVDQRSGRFVDCLLYTSPSPRDISGSRMPSSA